MKNEYGRSLIELIGVLAVTGVMGGVAIGLYNSIHRTQVRTMAMANLEDIAHKTKMLLEYRGTYDGVSVQYLVTAGAIHSDASPIGGEWTVRGEDGGAMFSINLTQLSEGDCDYFATATPSWAVHVRVNGYETEPDSHCFSTHTNQVSFIVE